MEGQEERGAVSGQIVLQPFGDEDGEMCCLIKPNREELKNRRLGSAEGSDATPLYQPTLVT